MYVREKRAGNYVYLQIVESYRKERRVKQRVIANLGRLDLLQTSGALDGILQSMSRYSEEIRVLSAFHNTALESCRCRTWGPVLIFEKLWKDQGMPGIIKTVMQDRRCSFDIERVCFAMALQRLCDPGSDLQGIFLGQHH